MYREYVQDVLVRADDDDAARLPVHTPQLEDVVGVRIGTEHLLVVDQAEPALPQQGRRHLVHGQVTMSLLRYGVKGGGLSGPLIFRPLMKCPIDPVTEGVGGLVGEGLSQIAEDDAHEQPVQAYAESKPAAAGQPGSGQHAGMGEPAFPDLHPAVVLADVDLAAVPRVRMTPRTRSVTTWRATAPHRVRRMPHRRARRLGAPTRAGIQRLLGPRSLR